MFEFHLDCANYFDMQCLYAKKAVLPFIHKTTPLQRQTVVLYMGYEKHNALTACPPIGSSGKGEEFEQLHGRLSTEWLQDLLDENLTRLTSKVILQSDFIIH